MSELARISAMLPYDLAYHLSGLMLKDKDADPAVIGPIVETFRRCWNQHMDDIWANQRLHRDKKRALVKLMIRKLRKFEQPMLEHFHGKGMDAALLTLSRLMQHLVSTRAFVFSDEFLAAWNAFDAEICSREENVRDLEREDTRRLAGQIMVHWLRYLRDAGLYQVAVYEVAA